MPALDKDIPNLFESFTVTLIMLIVITPSLLNFSPSVLYWPALPLLTESLTLVL